MRKAIIIHGFEGIGNSNFFPWLKQELEKNEFEVLLPDLPNSAHPDFDELTKFLKKLTKDFKEDDVIIGHSMGGFLAIQLASKLKCQNLFVVAPGSAQIDFKMLKEKWTSSNIQALKETLEHQIDLELAHVSNKVAFFSSDDPWIPFENKDILNDSWKVNEFHNTGHFQQETLYPLLYEILPDLMSMEE